MAQTPRPGDPATADFYAAAVYGSVVAAALLAAFRQESASARTELLALLSTMGVFWLAHVWSTIVGERIHEGRRFTLRHVAEIARAEWPLVEAAFGPAIVLLGSWAGAVSGETASAIAVSICLLQLLGWGFLVGHRAYDRLWAAVGAGFFNGALGLGLVALEVLIIHKK
jgi:hypothetical protein